MGRPAPIPRRSSHLGSAACYGRSDYGSHSSTSAASSRSKRHQGNHNQFQTLKMFPDGHLDSAKIERRAGGDLKAPGEACFSVGTVNLIGSGRDKARGEAGHTKAYAQAATPVTSAQAWKAWVRAARYWLAER